MDYLSELPNEILDQITHRLDDKSLVNLHGTNTRMKEFVEDNDILWYGKYNETIGSVPYESDANYYREYNGFMNFISHRNPSKLNIGDIDILLTNMDHLSYEVIKGLVVLFPENTHFRRLTLYCYIEDKKSFEFLRDNYILDPSQASDALAYSYNMEIAEILFNIPSIKHKFDTDNKYAGDVLVKLVKNHRDDVALYFYSNRSHRATFNPNILEYSDLRLTEFLLRTHHKPSDNVIMETIKKGDYKKLELFYKYGLNIDDGIKTNSYSEKWTLLTHAVRLSDFNLVKFALDRYASVNLVVGGKAPLHFINDIDLLIILIEYGADVNILDGDYRTPIYYVKDKEIAEKLIDNGAELDIADKFGDTPLHYCDSKIFTIILEHTQDINVENDRGNTPLDVSVFARNYYKTKLLVTAGAKSNEEHYYNKKYASYLSKFDKYIQDETAAEENMSRLQ